MKNRNYTKYSDYSNNNTRSEYPRNEEVDPVTVIKTLEECTMDELLEIANVENITLPQEITKEELIDLINTSREEKIQNTTPTNDENNNTDSVDNIDPEFVSDETNDMYLAGVVNTAKLNVRKEPNKDSEVLCIITKDTPVSIHTTEAYEDFHKVTIIVDHVVVEGYCMKEFISYV